METKRFKAEGLTIEQIATDLGISKTTVSRAVSGKGRVSAQTRLQVHEYINRHNQIPGAATYPKTYNIAMLLPNYYLELDLSFMRKCMSGICRIAMQRGYDVILCYAYREDMTQLQRQLENHKVDGVILTRTIDNDPAIELLNRYRIPCVAIGRAEEPETYTVDNDNARATTEMTRLLLQMGMRRLAFLAGQSNFHVTQQRLLGFIRGIEQYGLQVDRRLIMTEIESNEQRLDALENVLEHKPECLICSDDSLSIWMLKELEHRGLRVPEDIRIASLYDSEVLLESRPTITAAQFDASALGAIACRTLLDLLSGKECPRKQIQGYQVILRESTQV